MPGYCSDPPATPTLSNALANTLSTTINSATTFTCDSGYTSSGGSSAPYFVCLADQITTGIWSNANWGCNRMPN